MNLEVLEGEIRRGLSLLSDVPRIEKEKAALLFTLLCIQQARIYEDRAQTMLSSLSPILGRREEGGSRGDTIDSLLSLSPPLEEGVPDIFMTLLKKWESMSQEQRDSLNKPALTGNGLPLLGRAGPIEALSYHTGAVVESTNPLVGISGGLMELCEWLPTHPWEAEGEE